MSAPFTAVCSANPRPSVQNNINRFGSEWWRRDPYHVLGEGKKTLCGRDASEWLTIGPKEELDDDCCIRCRKLAEKAPRS